MNIPSKQFANEIRFFTLKKFFQEYGSFELIVKF